MAKFKMKNGKGKVVEMKSIHDATTFRQNPEWVEVFDDEPTVTPSTTKKVATKKAVPAVAVQQQTVEVKADK